MNFKSKLLIVLAILLTGLMLVSAASAADADMSVSDVPSNNQVAIDESLNEFTDNDSSVNALNAAPSEDVISLGAASKTTKLSYSEEYSYNESTGLYDATITVELDSSGLSYPTGNITIALDDDVYSASITKGNILRKSSAVVVLHGLEVKEYTISTNYSGDSTFKPITNDLHTFTVTLEDPELDFSILCPSSVYQGNTITLIGKIDKNADNRAGVYFRIDNGDWKEGTRTSTLLGDEITCDFDTSDLAVGDHTVTIKYDGYGMYKNDSATKTITVNSKPVPNVTISGVSEVVYDDSVTVSVDVTGSILNPPSGTVSFSLDGVNWYNETIGTIIKTVRHTFNNLTVGNYTVYVKYLGDSDYAAANNSKDFEVSKYNSTVTVTPIHGTIREIDSYLVTITVRDDEFLVIPTGNVYYSLDNSSWTEATMGIPFSLSGLSPGNYTIYAKYDGDSKHFGSTGTATLTVLPICEIIIDVADVTIGPDVKVNATLKDLRLMWEPSGNVSFKVDDGEWVTVKLTQDWFKSYASYIFTGLDVGNHTVYVKYDGDNHFIPINSSKTFEVTKITPTLDIVVNNITYGEDAKVNVTLDEDYLAKNPTGNISFKLGDGEWIVVPINDSLDKPFASYTFEGLAVGNYTVYVKYSGDDYFFSVDGSKDFTVRNKRSPVFNIDVNNITYGENVTVVATLPDNAAGTVTFILSNGDSITVPVSNGTAVAVFERLGANKYNVTGIYSGDSNYTQVNTTANFEVYKADPNINASVENITYGENATVVVTVPSDATGTVTVDLGSGISKTVPVEGGQAVAVFSGLGAGDYIVTVTYSGDQNYTDDEITTVFTVYKADPNISASVENITYGENATVVVTVASDATGNATVILSSSISSLGFFSNLGAHITGEITINLGNGISKTVPVEGGQAVAVFSGLGAGDYIVTVTYSGDQNYTDDEITTVFTVIRANPNINTTVEDIVYGEDEVVVVSVAADATGNVTIVISDDIDKLDPGVGITQTVSIVNGSASAVFEDLGANYYFVKVYYSGDNNYYGMTEGTGFNVSQAVPEVSASVEDITYGENATIIINVPSDATGNVSVDIEGFIYEVPIENGMATIVLDVFDAGNHTAYVTYSGDQNYTSAETNVTFNVAKADPTIYVDIGPNKPVITEIVEGDDVIVIATLPEDATGVVGFSLDGGKTWVLADIVNGTASYVFKGLKAGEYNLLVRYFGDTNYNPADLTTMFVVEKAPVDPKNSSSNTMPNAGNPLLVLLIALAGLGLGSLKRKF